MWGWGEMCTVSTYKRARAHHCELVSSLTVYTVSFFSGVQILTLPQQSRNQRMLPDTFCFPTLHPAQCLRHFNFLNENFSLKNTAYAEIEYINYQLNYNEFSELQSSQPLDQETLYYQHFGGPHVPPLVINLPLS